MENKQTPVEWLEAELDELEMFKNKRSLSLHLDLRAELFQQAKEMEKQHVMEFLEEYDSYIFRGGNTSEEEYYNYIYGQ